MRLNGGLLILERRLILESRSSIVALRDSFFIIREVVPKVDVHQVMYPAIIFLFICPAICTSCIKKQKQKSKEHSGFMDHEGNEKDSDKEKNQNPRFADK